VNLDHVQSKTFTIQELRSLLGVPEGKLDRFADLHRRALQPSIAEINQLSRFTLTATPNKIGRTVASVTIGWQVKADPQDAKQELARPKVGRQARREGVADAIVRSFPASGGIEFDTHWTGLKRASGCNMDNTMIAERFRSWCREKGISLDARNIEQTFQNFCAKVGKV
jgi:hypothetical protein